MGDIRILDPRFGAEMKHHQHHRPWPSSAYRGSHAPASRGPSFCYRPMPPMEALPPHPHPQWIPNHEFNYGRGGAGSSKGGDYYYLTPLYRNALPAPAPQALPAAYQIPPSPRMIVDHHQRPSRNRSTKSSGSAGMGRHSVPPCTCAVGRTRSLEDVRSEMSEWEEYSDMNGNRVRSSPKHNGVSKSRNGRRSMENLLEVDVDHDVGFQNGHKSPRHRHERILDNKPGKRRGSYMVRLFP